MKQKLLARTICWAMFAPLSVAQLEKIITEEWRKEFPYAIDPPPWQIISGSKDYVALVSSEPGTEGSDWKFAKIFSELAKGENVYSFWLDPERQAIWEWKNGKKKDVTPKGIFDLAESLGFRIAEI